MRGRGLAYRVVAAAAFGWLHAAPAGAGAPVQYYIYTHAGVGSPGFSGDGGAGTAAQLNFPRGVPVNNSSQTLYVVDEVNNRVRSVDNAGTITTYGGNGTAAFCGDGGPATSGCINGPYLGAIDSSGAVYIADRVNNRIRKIDASGIITTVAGNGTAGFAGDGGAATAAMLNNPWGVWWAPSGNLYISDRVNNRVRKVDTAGIITTYAGTGTASCTGDGGAATAATLSGPYGLSTDSAENLYVAMWGCARIRMIAFSTGIITTVAGTGVAGYSGDGGPATAAQINVPAGCFYDTGNNILFWTEQASHCIRIRDSAGLAWTVAGTTAGGWSGDGGPATAAMVNAPRGIWFRNDGVGFIGDTDNHRVRRLQPAQSATPSATHTISQSPTETLTMTVTPTATETSSRTATRTRTHTRTWTSTRTISGTATESLTPSESGTATVTATESETATATHTASETSPVTLTFTFTPTESPTATATATVTRSPTRTESATATGTASETYTASRTPSATASATPIYSATRTHTSTVTPICAGGAFPNPFRPATDAPVVIPLCTDKRVSVGIFALPGHIARTLPPEAIHEDRGFAEWDGVDDKGLLVASGLYLIRISSTNGVRILKVTVLR